MLHNDSIINYLFPSYCILCDLPGQVICEKCFSGVFRELPSCYICGRINSGYEAHTKCLSERKDSLYRFVFFGWRLDKKGRKILKGLEDKMIYSGWEYLAHRCLEKMPKRFLKVIHESKILPAENGGAVAKTLSKYSKEGVEKNKFLVVCESLSKLKEMEEVLLKIKKEYPNSEVIGFSLFGISKIKFVNKVGDVDPV